MLRPRGRHVRRYSGTPHMHEAQESPAPNNTSSIYVLHVGEVFDSSPPLVDCSDIDTLQVPLTTNHPASEPYWFGVELTDLVSILPIDLVVAMAAPKPLSFDREFTAAAAAMAEAGASIPQLPAGDVEGRRKFFEQFFSSRSSMIPSAPSVTKQEHQIEADDGSTLLLTEFRPNSAASTASPAAFYIHGGGMYLGSVPGFASSIALKAEALCLPIFAIGYRLAPEHPHPTPVNDCYAGLTWLHSHAEEVGVDVTRIMIYGESAGGGLAAGVALMARDRKLDPPLAFQMLIYPMLDDRNQKPIPTIEPHAMWKCDDNITGCGYHEDDGGIEKVR